MSVAKRHPLVGFFVLTYVLTWGALPWRSFFAAGPLLAAVIVVSITDGVAGLRELGLRVVRWRVGWISYAVAIGVPLLVHLSAAVSNLALGAASPSTANLVAWYGVPLAIGLGAISPVNGPLGEEPGFRGFALVRPVSYTHLTLPTTPYV